MTASLGLSHAVSLFLIGLIFVFPSQNSSLQVESAVAPNYPARTYGGGVAVVAVDVDRSGKRMGTELVWGDSPFAAAALDSVSHWKFTPSATADVSRTSITFVFRPRTMDRVPLAAYISRQQLAKPDRPPFPNQIFDTGYPQICVDQGAVVLELSVTDKGEVDEVRPILGVPALTGIAEMDIKSWTFSPAMSAGRPVPGSAIVVISFVHPAL
jgi:outer membrane biosynthesis protein TonB